MTRITETSIGQLTLTTYDDGLFALPQGYFTDIPEPLAAEIGDTVTIGANLWTIRSGARLILVDTGSAEALKAMFPDTGQAWGDLQAQTPTDIVLTHMHADHIGGLADPAAFPGAQIHVARAEWEFWTDPDLIARLPEDARPMAQMIQSVADGIKDRVTLHGADAEIAPGLTLAPLPGHTPGHVGLRLSSEGEDLLIVGDALISEKLHFAAPDVAYAMDGDAATTIETRKALLAEVEARGLRIAATHFAFPGMGRVTRDGAAYRFDTV